MLVERSEKSTKITKLIWGKEENWRPTREKFIACDFRGEERWRRASGRQGGKLTFGDYRSEEISRVVSFNGTIKGKAGASVAFAIHDAIDGKFVTKASFMAAAELARIVA